MADDVWAGIPVELREKVEAAMIAYAGAQVRGRCRSGLCVDDEDATDADFLALESHLCSALRSLLSRLQEAEKDAARLNWLELQVQHLPPAQGAPKTECLTLLWSPDNTLRNEIDTRLRCG